MIQAMMTWQQRSGENNEDYEANYDHGGNDSGNEDIQTTLMLPTTVAMMTENATVCDSRGKMDKSCINCCAKPVKCGSVRRKLW